jgi:hypothetical protein
LQALISEVSLPYVYRVIPAESTRRVLFSVALVAAFTVALVVGAVVGGAPASAVALGALVGGCVEE